MGELAVALFLAFFAALAIGAAGAQFYQFIRRSDRRNPPPRE